MHVEQRLLLLRWKLIEFRKFLPQVVNIIIQMFITLAIGL
jgi:hypothetical protein